MLRIGITGNIGAGKTTVLEILKKMDIPVVSSDDLVRSFQKQGNVLWQEIKKEWDQKYIRENGNINREKMRESLLNEPDFKQKIEEITHPLVHQEIKKIFNVWEKEGNKIAAAEVPLLYEAGWQDVFDKTILIWAPDELRIKRIMEERNLSKKDAKKWLGLQSSQQEKKGKADYVLNTQERVEDTEKKIKKILENIKEEG
ncbi:MAG: dephospho-CoA kinase [Elusimicrobiota bacterium]